MRRYYDPQGNQTGTSTSTAGKIATGCLGFVLLVIALSVIVGIFAH